MSHQAPGGKSSFSLGWGNDNEDSKATTSVKVRNNPGGSSSIVFGTDTNDYKSSNTHDAEAAQAAQERGEEVVSPSEEEEKKEEEEAKEPEAAGAAPVVEEKAEAKKTSGGILPGMDDKPHTSVKVRAPPGGKSSITF